MKLKCVKFSEIAIPTDMLQLLIIINYIKIREILNREAQSSLFNNRWSFIYLSSNFMYLQ